MTEKIPDAPAKAWFAVYALQPYPGQGEPCFFEDGHFPWAESLKAGAPAIRKELFAYLASGNGFKSHFNKKATPDGKSWASIPLISWGLRYGRRLRHFPETTRILQGINGLVSASFSSLGAGSSIAPHYGDTNAVTRVHLGLEIPATLPEAGFRVQGEERSWGEGELLIFCDGFVHGAWNFSQHDRIVMIIDVVRPEFLARQKQICATVLAGLALHMLISKAPALRYLLFLPFYLAIAAARGAALLLTPIHNKISSLLARK